MSGGAEFHYRLPGRARGWLPGAHAGSSLGGGEDFIAHLSLFARPDPRRLDLRASLRDLRGDWLVRLNRQRASVPVYAVVDVSASMGFPAPRPKIAVAADFVAALGRSSFRLGDPLGLLAFDGRLREELRVPPARVRGLGELMARMLREWRCQAPGVGGLAEAVGPLAGRRLLVFLVSDFHCRLDELEGAVEALAHALVVPIVVWSPAETEPPGRDGYAPLFDLESGATRSLWLRPRLRERWRAAVAARRDELARWFAARGLRPFHLIGEFDADALSRHFLEEP